MFSGCSVGAVSVQRVLGCLGARIGRLPQCRHRLLLLVVVLLLALLALLLVPVPVPALALVLVLVPMLALLSALVLCRRRCVHTLLCAGVSVTPQAGCGCSQGRCAVGATRGKDCHDARMPPPPQVEPLARLLGFVRPPACGQVWASRAHPSSTPTSMTSKERYNFRKGLAKDDK